MKENKKFWVSGEGFVLENFSSDGFEVRMFDRGEAWSMFPTWALANSFPS